MTFKLAWLTFSWLILPGSKMCVCPPGPGCTLYHLLTPACPLTSVSGLYINIILHETQEHNIGQGFALYYIAHAAYLELRGSYARADAVLQEGVRRCAAPTAFNLLVLN